MMAGGNLPIIGAQAALIGARQFELDATKVIDTLKKINEATGVLQNNTAAQLNTVTNGYEKYARGVGAASARILQAVAAITAAEAARGRGTGAGRAPTVSAEEKAALKAAKDAEREAEKARKLEEDWQFRLAQIKARLQNIDRIRQESVRKADSDWYFRLEKIRSDGAAKEATAAERQRRLDEAAALKKRKTEEDWQFRLEKIRLDGVRREQEAAQRVRRAAPPPPPIIPPVTGGIGAAAGGFGRGAAGLGILGAGVATAVGIGIFHIAEGLARVAVNSVKATAEFSKFLQPAIVLVEATTRQVTELSDQVLELSRNVEIGGNAIARLGSELAKEGLSLEQISNGALLAARNLQTLAAGELSAAQAANIISKALQAYKMPGEEAARVTQAIAGAAQRSAGNFSDYELALKRLTPVAGLLRIPIEEVTTAIALLNNAGLQGEQVGSNLLQLFLRMLNPTAKSAEIMRAYGVSLFDTNGKFIGLGNTFKVLDRAFSDQAIAMKGLTEAERDTDLAALGMSRSFLAALAIINQGPEAFDRTLDSIKTFNTDAAVARFADTLSGQINIAKNNVFALGEAFSRGLLTRIKDAVANINQSLQALSLSQARTSGQGLLDSLTGGALDVIERSIRNLAPAFAVLAENVSKIFSAAGGWDSLGKAILFIGSVLDSLQQAIALTVAGFGILIGKIPELVTAAAPVAEGFIVIIGGAFDTLSGIVVSVINSVLEHVNQFLSSLGTDVPGAFKFITDTVILFQAITITAVLVVTKAFRLLGIAMIEIFKAVWTVGAPFMQRIFNNVIQDIGSVIEAFRGWGQFVVDIFSQTIVPVIQEAFLFIANNVVPPLRDAFTTIATNFGEVIGFIKDRIIEFLQFAAQIPIVGKYFAAAEGFVSDTARVIDEFLVGLNARFGQVTAGGNSLGDLFKNLPNIILDSISSIAEDVAATFEGVLGFLRSFYPTIASVGTGVSDAFDSIRDTIKNAIPSLDNWMVKLRQIIAGAKEVRDAHQGWTGAAGVNAMPGRGAPIPELAPVTEDVTDRLLAKLRLILRTIPGITDEFIKFIAELVKADPARMQPIVNALKSQIPIIREILAAKRDLLTVELAIEQANRRIAAIDLQIARLDLQARQAALPLEARLLQLRGESLKVQQQLLPLQGQLAAIDKQIALLQRENFTLTIQRLQLQQQALPIENKIADIDKAIALTQRENLDLTRQRLLIEQQMMPIQNAIEDVQARIARLNREDFGLTRQRLQLELARLPIEHAIAAIDQRISDVQREDFDLIGRKLVLEQQTLGFKTQINAIDRQMADLQRTNFTLARARAQADLDALPIKQRIADIEQQITDSVDRQQQLTMQRNEMLAQRAVTTTQRQLSDVELQLENLWAKFNLRPTGADAASLVPQIIGLEAERARLENILKPAQLALTAIQRAQEDINFEQSLTINALEQQKLAEEALLRPIEDRIQALQREQDITDARNALTLLGLQQQRQAIEDLLRPIQDQIDAITVLQEATNLANQITINGLNRQKQLLQDLQRPYDDQLNRLREMQQVTTITQQIQETFLQQELQALQDILAPLQTKLLAIQRERDAQQLRADIVRNGLETEKRRWEDLLRPIQDSIDIIDRQRAAEDLRKQIAIAGLELQKQRIEDLIRPLQDLLDAIEAQTTAVELQRDIVVNSYEQQKIRLEALKLAEELYKNSLEQLRVVEQDRLAALISSFQAALIASGAFTAQEAADAVIRLSLWGSERDKVAELKLEIDRLNTALGTTAGGFNPLPAAISSTDDRLADLRDTIGDANNGLNKNLATLASTIGTNPNAGVQAALASLNTAAGNSVGNMSSLSTSASGIYNSMRSLSDLINFALVGIAPTSLLGSMQNLILKFDALETSINDTQGTDGGFGVRGLWSILNGFASPAVFGAYQNNLNALGLSFSGGTNNLLDRVNSVTGTDSPTTGVRGLISVINTFMNNMAGYMLNIFNLGGYFSGTDYSLGFKTDQARSAMSGLVTDINTLTGATIISNLSRLASALYGTNSDGVGYAVFLAASEVVRLRNVIFGNSDSLTNTISFIAQVAERFSGPEFSIAHRANLARDAVETLRVKISDTTTGMLNAVLQLADRFAGFDFSLAHKANLAKDSMNTLRDAINGVVGAQNTLNSATARYIATQATATGMAIQMYAEGAASSNTIYATVRNAILSGVIGFAEGGIVPGPLNSPMWAIVHGGERVIPTSAGTVAEPTRVRTGSTMNYYNNIVNNYNFSARYERMQDPITLSADVRSVIEMSKR